MFESEYSSLVSLDVSNWNTGNFRQMGGMFAGTRNLTTLDVSNWDTSNVVTMWSMFWNSGVEELNVSNWDISNVHDAHSLFWNAQGLQQIDVSDWDSSNLINIQNMFRSAENLTMLDLSSWDMSNVARMEDMLTNANSIQTLVLGEDVVLNASIGLPEIPVDTASTSQARFTGYWQNVGSGTIENPTGEHVLTSAELMANFDGATMADTFVWQRASSSTTGGNNNNENNSSGGSGNNNNKLPAAGAVGQGGAFALTGGALASLGAITAIVKSKKK